MHAARDALRTYGDRVPRACLRRAGLVLAAVLLLAGCTDTVAPAPRKAATKAKPTMSCSPAPLERRAAATLIAGMPHVTSASDALGRSLVDLGVGGLFLSEANVESARQLTALLRDLRSRARGPLLVSTDEESGRVALTREIVGPGPSPRRLARQQPPAQVRGFAAELGRELAGVGVNLDLAPLFDLDAGPSDGIVGDRSFSADPQIASEYALAFSNGLVDAGITPTVKHFPGQGRSAVDTHRDGGLVKATLQELQATDLRPFQDAIDAGAPVVMLNHLGYTALDGGLPATMSPKAYALLREMGFEGVAMTDSVGMGAVNLRWDFPEAAVRAVAAGADAVLVTDGTQAERMRDGLVDAVRSGRLPETRLNEAAARVTALAGGDPNRIACVAVQLPTFGRTAGAAPRPSGSATASARGSASAGPTASTGPARRSATPSPSSSPTPRKSPLVPVASPSSPLFRSAAPTTSPRSSPTSSPAG